MLRRHVSVYHEFPPVFQPSLTRWGDAWDPARYPTPEPLLDAAAVSAHPLFREEAMEYTWMCYVRLGRRSAGAAAAEVGA
jgi:hypothetical protein